MITHSYQLHTHINMRYRTGYRNKELLNRRVRIWIPNCRNFLISIYKYIARSVAHYKLVLSTKLSAAYKCSYQIELQAMHFVYYMSEENSVNWIYSRVRLQRIEQLHRETHVPAFIKHCVIYS